MTDITTKTILKGRYEKFNQLYGYLYGILQDWSISDEEEGKRVNSMLRATSNYLDYLEARLERLQKGE